MPMASLAYILSSPAISLNILILLYNVLNLSMREQHNIVFEGMKTKIL